MAWYKEIENIVFVYHYGIAICQQIESPLWVKFVLLNKFLALSNWEGQWKGILSLVLFPALSILLIPALSLDSVPVPAVCCRSGNWSLKTKKWTTRTPQAAETNKAKKKQPCYCCLVRAHEWCMHQEEVLVLVEAQPRRRWYRHQLVFQ